MHYDPKSDFYIRLGVKRNATSEEIQSAYKELAKELHPDVNKNDSDATVLFQAVTEAYEVLRNEEKRREYDLAWETWKHQVNDFSSSKKQENTVRDTLKKMILEMDSTQRSTFARWLVDEIMEEQEVEIFAQLIGNYLQGLHPLIDLDIDPENISLKHILDDDRNSSSITVSVQVKSIDKALEEGLLFQQQNSKNPFSGKAFNEEMRVKLHDGCVMTLKDIEFGNAYQCPTCLRWVQKRNIKRCFASGRLICVLCGIAVEKRLYSRKAWVWKTVKDFIGASYED